VPFTSVHGEKYRTEDILKKTIHKLNTTPPPKKTNKHQHGFTEVTSTTSLTICDDYFD